MKTEKREVGALLFSEEVCRRSMRFAIVSACFGALSQILVGESSLIILYAKKLNAGDFLALSTTSLQLLCTALLMVPVAFLMERTGEKRLLIPAIWTSFGAMLLLASAPWFGAWSTTVLMLSIVMFALSIAVYVSGWFSLLKNVVIDEERGKFFSNLRVSWQSTTAVFLAVSTLIVGKNAPMPVLQGIFMFAALMILGRIYFLAKLPERPRRAVPPFRECAAVILHNNRLMGFGLYLFFMYGFAAATVPVAIMFAKNRLDIADDFLVLLSFGLIIGQILGFFAGGRIVDRNGTKKLFLGAHFSFALVNLVLLFVHNDSGSARFLLMAVIVFHGVVFAAASIAVSSEVMALAVPELQTLSIAVITALYMGGCGLSRIISAWVLGSGMLASEWTMAGVAMTSYHTLFLFYSLGVTMTCVLLTMVPAVVGSHRFIPQG